MSTPSTLFYAVGALLVGCAPAAAVVIIRKYNSAFRRAEKEVSGDHIIDAEFTDITSRVQRASPSGSLTDLTI